MKPRPLELLAPAKDAETAIVAIDCGADAVYMGGPHHGARAAAANPVADIKRVCDYAHRFRVKVYVTFNTLIFEDELDEAVAAIGELYAAGVDALIVQDMSLLRLPIPPIALHASTQCDARTPARARFLQDVGMSCIVLPREASLDEIRAYADAVTVPLEAFVHGALCVSYSGDCRASLVNGGRSANRGECAQICRLPYDLVDGDGNTVVRNRYLLSLKDLNRSRRMGDMARAGVSSFKIEGRLKSADYVAVTVAALSRELDKVVAESAGAFVRASAGRSTPGFDPVLTKVFNRGFTTYALDGIAGIKAQTLASSLTPKWTGEDVGTVTKVISPRRFAVKATLPLQNGDGLGYFDSLGIYNGFRINKIEGNVVHTAADVRVKPGTRLMRNFDKANDDVLQAARPRRRIAVAMSLRAVPGGMALELADERGCRVETLAECELSAARSPQLDARRRVLEKLGDTIYAAGRIDDSLGEVFVPASVLTALRRRAVEMLDHAAAATYELPRRLPEDKSAVWPEGTHLTMHNNVANSVAAQFYRDHGATDIEPSLETDPDPSHREGEVHVMTSRYCLRRELGHCLKTPGGRLLKGPLTLRHTDGRVRDMRLEFDCAQCRMHVVALPIKSK